MALGGRLSPFSAEAAPGASPGPASWDGPQGASARRDRIWSHISRILRDRMPARSDPVAIGAALLGVPVAFLLLSAPTQAVPWLFRASLASGAFGVLTLGGRWWLLRLFQRDLDEGLVPGATLMWRLAWMHACHLVAWRLGLLTLSLGLLSVTLLLLGNAGSGGVVCILLAGFSLTALTPPLRMEPHRLALGALVPVRPPNADLACSQVFLLPQRMTWVTDEDATRARHRGRPSLLSAIHASFRLYRESGRSSLPLYAARYRPDDRAEARAVGLAGFCYLRYALILALLLVALGFPFLGPADDAPMAGAPLALAPTETSSDPESYPESGEEAPAETAADTSMGSPAESGGGAAGQSVSGAGPGDSRKSSGDGSEIDGDDVSGPGSDQGSDVTGSGGEGAGGGAPRRGGDAAEPDTKGSQSAQSGAVPSEGASGWQGELGAGPGQDDPGNPNTGSGDGGGTQLPGPGDPGPVERPQSPGGGDTGSQGAEEAGSGSQRAGSDGRDPQNASETGPQSVEGEPGGSQTAAADSAGSGTDDQDGDRGSDGPQSAESGGGEDQNTARSGGEDGSDAAPVDADSDLILIIIEEAATLGKDVLEIEGLQAAYGAEGGTVAVLREFELSDDPVGRTEPVADSKPPVQHLPAWVAELLASP